MVLRRPSDVHDRSHFSNVQVAYRELAKACYEGGPLDARSARLVKLGIAIGAQAEEVRHVGLLALTIGFPHTVAGLGWIEEVIASKD